MPETLYIHNTALPYWTIEQLLSNTNFKTTNVIKPFLNSLSAALAPEDIM